MPTKYDPELRARALRMLAEARPDHESLTAACRHVGGLLGVATETLRVWHHRHQIDSGHKPGVSTDMEAENRRLKRENTGGWPLRPESFCHRPGDRENGRNKTQANSLDLSPTPKQLNPTHSHDFVTPRIT